MDEIVSRRIGTVIRIGDSFGLTLREELIDIGLEPEKKAQISVLSQDKKRIVIEKVGE